MSQRILLSGGSGQLAEAIRRFWTDAEIICPPEDTFDLSQPESIHATVHAFHPHVIVNAGAFTQVDRCEDAEALAMKVNGEALTPLAEAANMVDALLVQISTDYVFNGTAARPYREDDPVEPTSAYGRSKLLGEQNALQAKRHLILRTAWLYDAWGKNFLLTMLNAAKQGRSLRVVDDQRGTPTTCRALTRQIRQAVHEGWQGLFHATCHGETTWFGFASEIFRQAGLRPDLSPCTTADYPTPAKRPAYSVLDGSKRAQTGIDLMPDWQTALNEVIDDLHSRGIHE